MSLVNLKQLYIKRKYYITFPTWRITRYYFFTWRIIMTWP